MIKSLYGTLWVIAALTALVAPPVAAQKADKPSFLMIDDFTGARVGEFPAGWDFRRKSDAPDNYYSIREEEGNRYLHAETDGGDVTIGRKFRWKLKDYPILTWRWRVSALPENGNEQDGPVDSAASIYIVFSQNLIRIPKTVKYTWSTTLPVGTVTRRDKIGRPWVIVMNSGPEHMGEWVTHRVNLMDDYKRSYGGKPPSRPLYIAILSDANGSKSRSVADYDDIRLEPAP